MQFSFVIPVYNHAATLASVLDGCIELGLPVIVVDDGSTDGITEVLARYDNITVIRHGRNIGKGEAIRSGLKEASKIADFAVTIDADGQHVPGDAVGLMESIQEGARPVVIGARKNMFDDESIPWTSRFGRKFSNFWVKLSGGPVLTDTQSGFRIYPVKEILSLKSRASRFQFEVEILVLANWHKIPVYEVPVSVVYPENGKRVSHFRPFVDFLRNSATFTRLIVMRLVFPQATRKRMSMS
ncbi:MAG TPA: glycosyltransferase family 2 protein [Desulfomonilia bacterium]